MPPTINPMPHPPQVFERITGVLDSIDSFWLQTVETALAEKMAARDRLGRLANCSLDEMILFFRHYRLFTIRRIDDLAIVQSRLPFGPFKAFMSKVLYEEFGLESDGGFANSHVALLDAFMVSLGASEKFCSNPDLELPANVRLLGDVTERLRTESLYYAVGLRGMGAECWFQVYVTAIFGQAENNPNFVERRDQLDLRLEEFHNGLLEAEHRTQLRDWIAELVSHNPQRLAQLKDGYEYARQSFHQFFDNIYAHIDSDAEKGLQTLISPP